ncbi:PREDICTED: zinc finger BED domain-containing protein 3 [Condylura cristata]|uniref:zinc finger BED domain-containing protein 3 n=1 Tax=Condylura cristata TaxID=143302 RepID=UPI00033478DF|nr:PREDICTED: zinc finger BED domain-containing protein 3 [Condylura cristata]
MRSDELAATMEDTRGPEDAAALGGPCAGLAPAPPGRLGAPYSEAWGYFHLAPARPGHAAGHWATCRLCGEQVSRGPGFHAGTPALWQHLKSAHGRAAVEQGERALERRRRALQEEERAVAQARRELQAEREALQTRLREVSRREGAAALAIAPQQTPLKEEPDAERDGYIITKVLL